MLYYAGVWVIVIVAVVVSGLNTRAHREKRL